MSHWYSIEKKRQSVWIITIENCQTVRIKKQVIMVGWTEEDVEITTIEKQVLRWSLNGKRNRMNIKKNIRTLAVHSNAKAKCAWHVSRVILREAKQQSILFNVWECRDTRKKKSRQNFWCYFFAHRWIKFCHVKQFIERHVF